MNIGIISDTHDHQENVLAALEIFNQHRVDYVLHAGDFTTHFTAELFARLRTAGFIAVFGNMDVNREKTMDVISAFNGEIHEKFYDGQINDKRIYMTHFDNQWEKVISRNNYDLAIYGHTHRSDIHRQNQTLIVNPGEATDRITGCPQVVILNLANMQYQVISLL